MALNPIAYTEHVVRSFLRYQLTAYPFADPHLHAQMRELLSLDETRRSPLLKGPYVSLSRPFRQGAAVETLIGEGLLHPHLRDRIPEQLTHVYGHQERALHAVAEGRTTLVSTGTGSGKTECFLYPVVSQCLRLRDDDAPPGISAVIVYPMNALAEDQLMRLRSLLAGTGIPFGMYVGKTPEHETEVAGVRLSPGSSRADYEARLAQARRDGSGETIYPAEEVCSREVMRSPGRQPRILLTNVKQLELLLTRQQDIELFAGARLDFLVFDEAHTFTGALGAETACLVRRLRTFCQVDPTGTTCIATSATIVDHDDPQAGLNFAARFFGVSSDNVAAVGEDYEPEVWVEPRHVPPATAEDSAGILDRSVRAVDAVENDASAGQAVREVYRALAGEDLAGELVAFANAAGGTVFLGVDDSGAVAGIPPARLDAVERWIVNIASHNCEPPIRPILRKVLLPASTGEERHVLLAEVPRGLYVHRTSGGRYYLRVGSTRRDLTPPELARLFQQRGREYVFDEQPVLAATVDHLNRHRLEAFFGRSPTIPWLDLLRNTRVTHRDEGGVDRPTVAGLLTFGSTDQVFLESRGEGVRKILRNGEAHSGRRPEYELFGDELRLTLWAKSGPATD